RRSWAPWPVTGRNDTPSDRSWTIRLSGSQPDHREHAVRFCLVLRVPGLGTDDPLPALFPACAVKLFRRHPELAARELYPYLVRVRRHVEVPAGVGGRAGSRYDDQPRLIAAGEPGHRRFAGQPGLAPTGGEEEYLHSHEPVALAAVLAAHPAPYPSADRARRPWCAGTSGTGRSVKAHDWPPILDRFMMPASDTLTSSHPAPRPGSGWLPRQPRQIATPGRCRARRLSRFPARNATPSAHHPLRINKESLD